MKSFTISAFFPEVKPAHEAWQTVTVQGSDVSIAVARALRELRARPGIVGKHVSEIRLTITIHDPQLHFPQ